MFGHINGTPTTAGPYNFSVTATDNQGASLTQPYSINIQGPLAITPATLPQAAVGSVYSQQLTPGGGSNGGHPCL